MCIHGFYTVGGVMSLLHLVSRYLVDARFSHFDQVFCGSSVSKNNLPRERLQKEIFGVFGVETVDLKTIEVMEGDPVMLETCLNKIQKDDEIEWKFGSNGPVIAKIKANNALLYDSDDVMFSDRLHLDAQTGDLTIRNTRIKHSGTYELKIINGTHTIQKRFSVTVIDAIPKKVSVIEGDSVPLVHDITDIEKYDVIEWMFGAEGPVIAEIDKQKSEIPSYNDADGKFRGRLLLDDQSGSLTITKITSTDAGLYKLKVFGTNRDAKERKFRVTVSAVGLSSGVIAAIIVCVIVFVSAAAAVGCICHKRRTQRLL
ncbi:uncharacterized protein LOC127439020 isoform X2 [Myxocyprinus asiaticus]|uniref:uncharacterized protein LOC127439020 isoform X2 n=1 Tax=Myxocyprinus asiaticus TaxID=70543 RepID=UPI002223E6D4|nr:uncharacterized protein LOC127439020 isoform X2 [Myxocyprinus asiaticus]